MPYNVSPYSDNHYKNLSGPSTLFTREGYISVYRDVRGRWMNEGDNLNQLLFC
ncbi:CocE/NonD family hydrolase [Pedobacter sp. BS3]|uniref:CocE/NonD family hydrolase n=1 Tax=Pedobacter sp. BS3 TaxID=2567937 RepID=UPI001F5C0355|nr:CocE/NonD family hydrolase [Pedobacter sp. BS3]